MFAVIRVKGTVGINPDNKKTLDLLMLHKPNHLVLIQKNDSNEKMIKKVEPFITWGEIEEKTLEKLLIKRARKSGNKRIEEDELKKEKIVQKLLKENKKLKDLGLKPVIRLNPPSKGFETKGIKKNYSMGGAIGYRGQDINTLIKRMM